MQGHIIKSDNYNIYTGKNVLKEIANFLLQPRYIKSKVFVMVDENTYKHCLPLLLSHIESLQEAEVIEVTNGEENKNIDVCIQVWETLTNLGADRKSLFINLGGGVISDMGGFIASTFKRGIDFINVPTSLLAQVDASVGGKLGIDLDGIKNQIGLFNNPAAVFIYPNFLDTLDSRQLLSGFAEIIKHGLIADMDFWHSVKNADLENITLLERIIVESIEIKNRIVLEDPYEMNMRKSLNFGHTIGHAVETFSMLNNKLPLLHGEAVAIGMVCEAWLSSKIAGLPVSQLNEVVSFLKSQYAPYTIPPSIDEQLISLMHNDKKNELGEIHFSLLKKIGHCVINQSCSNVQLIKEALAFYRKEFNNTVRLN